MTQHLVSDASAQRHAICAYVPESLAFVKFHRQFHASLYTDTCGAVQGNELAPSTAYGKHELEAGSTCETLKENLMIPCRYVNECASQSLQP